MTTLFVRNGNFELWRGGDTPSSFARLRWWGVKGAVEANDEGCERSRVARRSWHGGGEGYLAEVSRMALYRDHGGHI